MLRLFLKICKWLVFKLETNGPHEENEDEVSDFEEEVEDDDRFSTESAAAISDS